AAVGPGAEAGVVPIGERALLGTGREIGAQPLLLRGPCAHAEVRVERDDVPLAHVVAVVVLRRVATGGAEVVPVAEGVRLVIVMVARGRPRPRLVPAPRGRVALG